MLFALLVVLSLHQTAHAQMNLAPSATATAFTSDPNGLWNWSQINNNSFNTCGNQEAFIWTSTNGIQGNEYMQWTWSSAKSINKIRFHNAWNNTRNLTAGDVYYFNGTTYVFWKTINIAQACVDSASFPTVTTTSLRITNFKMTAGGQLSNPSWREIEVISGASVNNDAGVAAISNLDFCTNTQSLGVRVYNFGKLGLDSVRLDWSINGTPQTTRYITASPKIASGKDTLIVLNPSYTFTNNTMYQFKFWTSRPNGSATDSVAANDTLKYNLNFYGNPPTPTTQNYIQCGQGRPLLRASTGSTSDTIMWYTSATGGNPIGMGASILGPKITATTTFYAQAFRFVTKSALNNGYTGTTVVSFNYSAYNGNYFDITAYAPINLDSMQFRIYNFTPTTNYLLYYKSGSFNGFETNSSAWTLVNGGGGRVYSTGGQYFIKVSTKGLMLSANTTYGFYFTIDPTTGGGNEIWLKGSTAPKANADLLIVGGKYAYGLFGATSFGPTWTIDMEVSYSKACINPSRSALVVTVKPRPTGADVVKGAPFNGQFNVGDFTKPDVAEVGKTITYELAPPTGYINADHGSTWVVNNVVAKTRFGSIVPSNLYTVVAPSSSGNGSISFAPTSTYLDSFITFSTNFSDLGPHYCDSTVTRTLIVAPTPKTNFKFPSVICLGDAILFENTTTIHSGNASYMWYFGDGDSSDLQAPVHEYKNSGSYQVKLVAKSTPWGIIKDTTIQVEVGELPVVKFRANNKCFGLPVTFQNQTTVGNGVISYDWDFGDGSAHSTANNPSHNYSAPGGYKVTLKASANGCEAVLVKNAYSFAKPVANFAAPLNPICAKSDVVLPNTSTIALGQMGAFWRFGDGASATQYDGVHQYVAAGTYAVKLLAVSEFDCKDSITKNVTIKATPNPSFVANQFCGKKPTTFNNTTFEELPSPTYEWNFSDGVNSLLKNITRTWPSEGPYSVTLKASYSNGCSAATTQDVEVLIQPKADFSVQDICSGEAANFVNLSKGDKGGIQYNWDFGNGTYSTVDAPVRLFNPTTTTTYTVSLVASYAGACSDTIRKTLTVSESPVTDFTSKDLGLMQVSFKPTNLTYAKYEWFFGEGGTSTQTQPVYQYLYTGNFNVTLKATNAAGCATSITKRASATTNINNFNNNNAISIYPNPNNGKFTVNNPEANTINIEVFNVLGEKVYSKISNEANTVVELNSHAKGVYLVKVTSNGSTTTTKITVAN